MRNLQISLSSYCTSNEFELLEVSRRRRYRDGEPIEKYDTVYKALINYEPTEIKIEGETDILQEADKVIAYVQAGRPLKVVFTDCSITVFPKSQYELAIRGTASKADVTTPKTSKASQE